MLKGCLLGKSELIRSEPISHFLMNTTENATNPSDKIDRQSTHYFNRCANTHIVHVEATLAHNIEKSVRFMSEYRRRLCNIFQRAVRLWFNRNAPIFNPELSKHERLKNVCARGHTPYYSQDLLCSWAVRPFRSRASGPNIDTIPINWLKQETHACHRHFTCEQIELCQMKIQTHLREHIGGRSKTGTHNWIKSIKTWLIGT